MPLISLMFWINKARNLGAFMFFSIVFLVPTVASAGKFRSLYVFGDSLNDPGNACALTSGFPPEPYYMGRFSNGPVVAEYLADLMKVESQPFYAISSGTNFAIGGATTGTENFVYLFPFEASGINDLFLPDLEYSGMLQQLEDFLDTSPSIDGKSMLFFVSGGANDIFLSLTQYPNGQNVPSALYQAVQKITANILSLAQQGARNFLVPNLPNLGATPKFYATPGAEPMQNIVIAFNTLLSSELAQLQSSLGKNVRIRVFDAYGFFERVTHAPEKYGFTNISSQCLLEGSPDCAGFLFFDSVHPTTKGHLLYAKELNKVVQNWEDGND